MKNTKPLRIGNIYGSQYGTGYAGNVWDKEAIAPAIMTMQGGQRTDDNRDCVPKDYTIVQRVGDRDKVAYSQKPYAFTIPSNPMSDRVQMVIELCYEDREPAQRTD